MAKVLLILFIWLVFESTGIVLLKKGMGRIGEVQTVNAAAIIRVVKAGAKPIYAPRDEPWGMRSCMVADPEGNIIEIGSWNKGA